MEAVKKLEDKVAEIHKGVPHLPVAARDWLVVNAWWIVLAAVILGAMSLFVALNSLISLNIAMSTVGDYGLAFAPWFGFTLVSLWVTFLFSAAALVFEAMAINPLKTQLKKGWDLLFLGSLVTLAGGIAGVILGNFFSIFGLAVGVAIGWYFLFEVRDGFDGKTFEPDASASVDGAKKEV